MSLALKAAKRADDLSEGKNGAIADTLAKAYYDSGDAKKALEAQERAVKLSGENADPDMKDRLETYKKAAQKDGDK